MTTIIKRPVDPARKRYYLVREDFVNRNPGDMQILNEDEFIENGRRGGTHEVRVSAGKDVEGYDLYYGGWYGLPKLYAKPRIKVALRNKPNDVYWTRGYIFFSSRAKALLESIDADAFEFAECETTTRRGREIEPYWLGAVKRVVHSFDEEHSVYREVGGRDPKPVPAGRAACIQALYEIRMLPDLPENFHAFYLLKYRTKFIWDQAIVDEWRAKKFNALIFSPLQPPSAKELRSAATYDNWEFFYEKDRHIWEDLL